MTISTRQRQATAVTHPMQAGRIVLAAASAIVRTLANRRQARLLSDMPDYLLKDLGLKRDDVAEALGTHWREDPTFRLALSAARRRIGIAD